jgi:site-specific DNA-methyltransferase (adenine-specific)
VGLKKGRWPANVIHDGSDEVVSLFPETASGKPGNSIRNSKGFSGIGDSRLNKPIPLTGFGDTGSAARFFYLRQGKRERAQRIEASDCEAYRFDALSLPACHAARRENPGSIRGVRDNRASC